VSSEYTNGHFLYILKYIKKIFKVPTSVYSKCLAKDNTENLAENLDSIFPTRKTCINKPRTLRK